MNQILNVSFKHEEDLNRCVFVNNTPILEDRNLMHHLVPEARSYMKDLFDDRWLSLGGIADVLSRRQFTSWHEEALFYIVSGMVLYDSSEGLRDEILRNIIEDENITYMSEAMENLSSLKSMQFAIMEECANKSRIQSIIALLIVGLVFVAWEKMRNDLETRLRIRVYLLKRKINSLRKSNEN